MTATGGSQREPGTGRIEMKLTADRREHPHVVSARARCSSRNVFGFRLLDGSIRSLGL
jgi:hypothetical protein